MSHVVVSCPRDRYKAHQFLEKKFRGDSPVRNYQWLPIDAAALVRFGEVEAPTEDTVMFTITALPQRKMGKNKRRAHLSPSQQCEWLVRHLMLHAGLEVTGIENQVDPGPVRIKYNGNYFTKHGIQFDGIAVVRDRDLLKTALNTGVGDGKAYGFGMLIVQGIDQ